MKFSQLSKYFEKLENTSSRLSMTEKLADLFHHASSSEIGKICYLLQGKVAPLYEGIEFGVADKFMIRAIAKAYEKEISDVDKIFRKVGDLGIAAQELHPKKNLGSSLSVDEVFSHLEKITKTGGEGSQEIKINLLSDLFTKIDSLSARYIARIPLGKLRLGFSDMTILDALSWMISEDKSQREALEAAYNVRPDIGYLAKTVKEKGVKGLTHIHALVGAPILPALCQRIPTAGEMIEKMGEVSVEPKFDGVRVEIHVEKSKVKSQKLKVKTFSRNLENTTEMFPELEKIDQQIDAEEVILDTEAVGVDPKTGKILPFQETTTRKRKHNIQLALEEVPLRFYVFDILYKDGKELLAIPLKDRRKILEQTIMQGKLLIIAPHIVTSDPNKIISYHDEQRKNGLEGVVVKKWDGLYESGRRSFNWVKFKEEEGKTGKLTDTIDAVVMGYYRGEGKRSDFGIGAFLVGVKKNDGFVTVTKIGTGVSDEQWRQLYKQFEKIKVKEKPKEYEEVNKIFDPDVWLAPKIVVEVAGDDLTKSPTHGAGYAVRFPRLVKIREDKSPNETTTVEEVKDLYALQ